MNAKLRELIGENMTGCSDCTHTHTDSGEEVAVPSSVYPRIGLEEALSIEAPYVKAVGAAGTGKTEYLVRKVLAFTEAGVPHEEIAVILATPDACRAFEERLSTAGVDTEKMTIKTILQLCIEILECESAKAHTERTPRVLNDAEYKLILEDLKTLGIQPSRLKKMLNYFYFQWSQLEPEEEWLLPREEHGVRDDLDTHLRLRGAMLREEVAPVSVKYLSGVSDSERPSFDVLLVDDFQNLSKASQTVCDLMARKTLIITGNENQLIEGFDPYPHKEGLICFERHYKGATCVQLANNLRSSDAIAAIGNSLCEYGSQSIERSSKLKGPVNKSDITQIKWSTPDHELTGLAYVIKDLLKKEYDGEVGEMYLVAPNRTWAKSLAAALSKEGIESTISLDAQPLVGDPRVEDKAGMLLAYTKLNLAADPSDVVAWRSWCGFGDHLCYSGAWTRLEKWAKEQGLSLLEALAALFDLEKEPFLEAAVLKERYRSGKEVIKTLAEKRGFKLVQAITDNKDTFGFTDLLEPIEGEEDAQALFGRVKERILEPSFEQDSRKLRIGSYKRLQGLSPKAVVISGLIDGFMPPRDCFDAALLEHDREKELDIYRKIFYNAVTKPDVRLVLSTIQKAKLELAETMRMEVRRVKMERGERMAMLSPSVFIEEAGDSIPGSLSGEQYLSEL